MAQIIERRWEDREYQSGTQSILSTYVLHRNGKLIGNFARAWRKACARAEVPGTLFHDLLRTAVRDTIRGSVSQHVAMAIAGHKTSSRFQRYNITSVEDKLDALRRRQAYLEARSSRSNVVALRDRGLGQTLGQATEKGGIS